MRNPRSVLAAGAALLCCGLASATHAQALNAATFTMPTAALGDGTDSYSNAIGTSTGLSTSRVYATSTAAGGWTYGYSLSPNTDLLSFGIEFYSSAARTVTGAGTFVVTFSRDVLFTNRTALAFAPGATVFSIGGTILNDGDRIYASVSPYSIDWVTNWTGSGFTFHASASFAIVPLPGAAMLAATGIMAPTRRRRR